MKVWIAAIVSSVCWAISLHAAEIPVAATKADIPRLLRSTEVVRTMAESTLREMVPVQSGLHYVGCPNCRGGRQEGQLTWSEEEPSEVRCRYCDHRYPSKKYPMDAVVTVKTPKGSVAQYPYWADEKGYRYFFAAKRDDEVKKYLAERTRDLAILYALTKDQQYARRAGILLDRFAEVFPAWCYHYDYPFQQKQIYDGDVLPKDFRGGYRTARWHWWAYSDVPLPLVQAYDWVRESGELEKLSSERKIDVAMRIENDLIRNACDQVVANREAMTNMSPRAWQAMIMVGRVLRKPEYVHEAVRRVRSLVKTQFFYDGMWSEGSPDYASQTVGGLHEVLQQLEGYSDPPGFHDPTDGTRFDLLQLEQEFPELRAARDVLAKMRLPDGRSVPVHDTWSTSQRGALKTTEPFLLPALGHACLGAGDSADQIQFHLTWSGGYGHSHADNLSLLLFSDQQETLSDLGYTHTAYRGWTLASAAHNLVVIDGVNQQLGNRSSPSDGRLLRCDLTDPAVQWAAADGARGYSGLAKKYERMLMLIDRGSIRLGVDRFLVEGGSTHDYFLHGNADEPTDIEATGELQRIDTLLPKGLDWSPTRNEGEAGRVAQRHFAYGFLRDLRAKPISNNESQVVTFSTHAKPDTGVRIHLMPVGEQAELVLGRNPAVRPAGEDDSKLDQYFRPFMMLRNTSPNSRSEFLSVIEPFHGDQLDSQVERWTTGDEGVALAIRKGDELCVVCFDMPQKFRLPIREIECTFRGGLGVIIFKNEQVVYATAADGGEWNWQQQSLVAKSKCSGRLTEVRDSYLVVEPDEAEADWEAPKPRSVVRLVTEDDWVYPFQVLRSERVQGQWRVFVAERPSMHYDLQAGSLELVSFPQRRHKGHVQVDWIPRVVYDRGDSK